MYNAVHINAITLTCFNNSAVTFIKTHSSSPQKKSHLIGNRWVIKLKILIDTWKHKYHFNTSIRIGNSETKMKISIIFTGDMECTYRTIRKNEEITNGVICNCCKTNWANLSHKNPCEHPFKYVNLHENTGWFFSRNDSA